MYSKSHFAVSVVLGAAVAIVAGVPLGRAIALTAYAAVLGTAIDLDHFVIARLRAGDWRHLRYVLAHPRAGLLEQDRIFSDGDVGAQSRLLSHALLGGALVAGLAFVAPFLALFSGLVVYVHVVCDLVAGVQQYERF